jgi:pimeloyl-ACP methyl ester carboxylesterase
MAPVPAAESVPSTDGVTVVLHDLGGDGLPLLLCHPTGFHGLVWGPVAAALADVARCWSLDFRGHGDSTAPADGDMAWRGMADDVLAVTDHLGVTDVSAVGHSMGGAALVLAEQRRPGTFRGLWLFEPIVFPPPEGLRPAESNMAAAARRRRPSFPDRDAAYANYAAKPPLGSLHPAALRAYVDHGFRDAPGGGVELKCTPEMEARIFEAGAHQTAFEHLGEVGCEVTVAASGDGGPPAELAALVASRLSRGRLERHRTVSHFGPQEDPVGIAAAIRHALHLGATTDR